LEEGYSPSDAVLQAAQYAIMMHRPDLLEDGQDVAEVKEPKKPKVDPAKKKRTARKQKTKLKDKIDKASRSPSKLPTGESRERNRDPVAADMSEEEFDALPESKLARMRGDIV
jgi:hypothetical protein